MNVLWLNSDRMGCGTYRCYVPALSLQDRGFDNHFVEHKFVDRPTLTADADIPGGVDVAIFQRAVGTFFVDWIKAFRARDTATIFECDDDLFGVPRHNPSYGFWGHKKVRKVLHETLALVDAIIVSTVPLRERLIEFGYDASKIFVCHNHLHPRVWDEAVKQTEHADNKGYTVIGWQGSSTHDVDFREALPALGRIAKERLDVMFRFFGSVPHTIRGVIPEERFQWSMGVTFEKYPSAMKYMHFDIGLAPVTDSKFNQSKSNLKWMEYSILGIPCVASRVYPYATSIDHGTTGYLASSEEEWYTALTTLLDSPELRTQIGQQARTHVMTHWYPETHIGNWERAITAAVSARRGVHVLAPGLR
jgi:glycosyltransferase involved in cell wall biosynthesis